MERKLWTKGIYDPSEMLEINCFLKFFPTKYLEEILLSAPSKHVVVTGKLKPSVSEMKECLDAR